MDSNKQNFLFKFGEIKCSDTGTPQKGVEKVENPTPEKPLILPTDGVPDMTKAVHQIGETMKTMQESTTRGPDCLPLSEGHMTDINIVQDFPWTKTSIRSPILQHTPTITLEELTVSSPAFFNNIILITDQFIVSGKTGHDPHGTGKVLTQIADTLTEASMVDNPNYDPATDDGSAGRGPTIDSWAGVPKFLKKSTARALSGISFVRDMAVALKQVGYGVNPVSNAPPHLKNYEPMYGIRPTNFMYRLPYMADSIKEISNTWSTDSSIVGGHLDLMKKITSLVSPGVGIDLSKTFDFPDSGPSYEINFYLDNQGSSNDWKRNFRLIYLLLYQNLPNKLTRTALTPPVIYRANLPGVFSFYWSFLSNIAVKFMGNRRTAFLKVGATDPNESEVVIPEGYEIKLTLTSLTPETRNLMYNALGGNVTSSIDNSPVLPDLNFPTT